MPGPHYPASIREIEYNIWVGDQSVSSAVALPADSVLFIMTDLPGY